MNKRKIRTTAAAIALAAILALGGGSLAYFTWTSSEIENVAANNYNWVSLTETGVKDDGEETTIGGSSGDTAKNDTYEIIPGTSQDKDPLVTASYSMDSYVFVKVTDTSGGLITWYPASGWKELTALTTTDADGTVTYVFYKLLEIDDESADKTTTTDSDGNTYTYYLTELDVLDGDSISYSSSITNSGNGITVKDGGEPTVTAANYSLSFQAYIIQAQLSGTTGDEDSYADPATAYSVVTTGASTYYEGATYVAIEADDDTDLATALTTALESANSETTTVIVLPSDDNDVTLTASALTNAITGAAVIDLNDGGLTISNATSVTLSDGDNLTIANGEVTNMEMTSAVTSAFNVKASSSLTLENVTLTTNGCALYAQGNTAEVNVINSTVTAESYAVSTNAASVNNYSVVINVENSSLYANGCAALINVPGTLNISDSKVTGGTQAMIVRAGTANVTDSTLISTLSEDDYGEGIWATYDSQNWGSGNAVAFSVITIGNRNGSYSGDATVYLDGVTVQYNDTEADSKGVYLYGGVTYPTTNTSPNKAILNYDSSNCTLGTIIRGETGYTEINGSYSVSDDNTD